MANEVVHGGPVLPAGVEFDKSEMMMIDAFKPKALHCELIPLDRLQQIRETLDGVLACNREQAVGICRAIIAMYPNDNLNQMKPQDPRVKGWFEAVVGIFMSMPADIARHVPKAVRLSHASSTLPSAGKLQAICKGVMQARSKVSYRVGQMIAEYSYREDLQKREQRQRAFKKNSAQAGGALELLASEGDDAAAFFIRKSNAPLIEKDDDYVNANSIREATNSSGSSGSGEARQSDNGGSNDGRRRGNSGKRGLRSVGSIQADHEERSD